MDQGASDNKYLKIILIMLFLSVASVILFGQYNESVFNRLIIFIQDYRYEALLAVAFLAGLIVPIPLNILLLAAGAFSAAGEFSFSGALALATMGNVLGDLVAFYFFRRYGHSILRDQFVRRYSFFLRLEKYFRNHVDLSIFISRIVGIFGTPVNFLSGYFQIPLWRFFTWDAIGNFVFVLTLLCIGRLVGDAWINLQNAVSLITDISSVALLSIVLYFIYKQNNLAR